MIDTPTPPTPPDKQRRDEFILGMFAWFLFNVIVGWFASNFTQYPGQVIGAANLAYFVIVGIKRPWFALGAIGCVAGLFVLGAVAFAFLAVVCGSMYSS